MHSNVVLITFFQILIIVRPKVFVGNGKIIFAVLVRRIVVSKNTLVISANELG